MEEKPTLFNSQVNQVSLNPPPPPVKLYFVPGEGHEETSLLERVSTWQLSVSLPVETPFSQLTQL